jgi:predicted nucleotidyltransferase component of viral defense system
VIPRFALAGWRRDHPWRDDRQVEQDMLLSRLAIEIASQRRLADRLVWRGGTCLHKIHLPVARRYSEDLDYVLVGASGPTGWLVDDLREAIAAAEMTLDNREVTGRSVKVWASTEAASGGRVGIKVEVNTSDAEPLMALERRAHEIEVRRWWAGGAELLTFQAPELVGTKFRALAQRSKGRDLWDLWLARRELSISDRDLARCGHYYLAHEDIGASAFRARLAAHLDAPGFVDDLDPLVVAHPDPYEVQVVGLELISWTDQHLDPLFDADRSPGAIARQRQRWADDGWVEGAQRCPIHERNRNGAYTRCPTWYMAEDGGCPAHRPSTPLATKAAPAQ